MTDIYCVVGNGLDDVLFISLDQHEAVEYYKKIKSYRKKKYVVKTQLNKEIKEGMCNEETIVSRHFSTPDYELLKQRQILHENIDNLKKTSQ